MNSISHVLTAKKGPWMGVVGVGRWTLTPRPSMGIARLQNAYGHSPPVRLWAMSQSTLKLGA